MGETSETPGLISKGDNWRVSGLYKHNTVGFSPVGYLSGVFYTLYGQG